MKKIRVIISFIIFILISILLGCSSIEKQAGHINARYNSYVDTREAKNIFDYDIDSRKCNALVVGKMEDRAKQMAENGYIYIGDARIPGREYNIKSVELHCNNIGAEIALFEYRLVGVSNYTIPVNTLTTSFANTTYQGQIGNYIGSSRTTFSKYETRYVPVSRASFINWMTYWVKAKPPILGAYYGELTDKIKYEAESNTGAYVYLIIKDSPAYFSNLLAGDVITGVNQTTIYEPGGGCKGFCVNGPVGQ